MRLLFVGAQVDNVWWFRIETIRLPGFRWLPPHGYGVLNRMILEEGFRQSSS
jgi:hypothetical protein